MDLDKVLSAYASSQKFHLVDLGAYFIVGPLGAVALKGYRYGDIYYQSQGGKGTITQFISHWKIKNGEADATDCALATHHNRVALKGKLDLVNDRFDNVTVALLDDKGCPRFKQSISGSFGSPSVGTVSAVESLAGPFLNLYRKAKRFVQGGKCEVFYDGTVQQPR
jgi:AsmA protein